MAVQAQYPSNVLLFNRNGQEGNEYSLQPQPQPQPGPAGFLDQSHMLFNKRGRDVCAEAAVNMHPNTGLRLSLADQQSQSFFSHDFTSQMKHHRDELDQFLQAQGEQLRRTLAERRQRDYRALVGAASQRVRDKEAEVDKARRRNAELEARAAQLTVEAQLWQAKARAHEATAASLQAQLHQAMAMAQEEGPGPAEDAESAAYVDQAGPGCRACGTRVASVVVLPCRHFCLCTQCDQVAQACPLCLTIRNSSVTVFLS